MSIKKAITYITERDLHKSIEGGNPPKDRAEVQKLLLSLYEWIDQRPDYEKWAFDEGYHAGYLEAQLERKETQQ